MTDKLDDPKGAEANDARRPPPASTADAGSAGKGATPPRQRHWRQAVRQFFWLDERMADAVRQGYGPANPGWEDFRFGRALLADADRLGESEEGRASSLALLRAATGLMIRAQLARIGIDPGPTAPSDECWARLQGHPTVAPLAASITDEERALVGSALGAQGDSVLARLPRDRIALANRALTKLARGLSAPMVAEAKRTRRVWFLRGYRVAAAALIVGLGVWLATRERELDLGTNLALHRPVTVVTPHPDYGRNPGLLVDGDRTNLGIHTISAPNQNVTVDLGSVMRISHVVVYNRTDCCFDRVVPLVLAVSTDGKVFQQVSERKDLFQRWVVKLPGTTARYVRLTNLKNDYFHLAEVEVY
jgi:hypothetical protein